MINFAPLGNCVVGSGTVVQARCLFYCEGYRCSAPLFPSLSSFFRYASFQLASEVGCCRVFVRRTMMSYSGCSSTPTRKPGATRGKTAASNSTPTPRPTLDRSMIYWPWWTSWTAATRLPRRRKPRRAPAMTSRHRPCLLCPLPTDRQGAAAERFLRRGLRPQLWPTRLLALAASRSTRRVTTNFDSEPSATSIRAANCPSFYRRGKDSEPAPADHWV